MLNKQEINFLPFLLSTEEMGLFLLELCLCKGCSMEPVFATTLNLWHVRKKLMVGAKTTSDVSMC